MSAGGPPPVAPTLSIVTICLDDRVGLERTLGSVAGQTFTDFELLVVDGGSTDGSLEVIEAFAPRIRTWVSGRDGGVYQAQNKGIGLARGHWVLLLNAGDLLASPRALEELFAAAPTEELLYGDVIYADERRRELHRFPDRLGLSYLMRSMICTQATLWGRELLERLGRHDLSLRFLADYDLLMRALLLERASTRHLPVTLAVHHWGGMSSRPEHADAVARERAEVQRRWVAPAVLELYDAFLEAREQTVPRRLRALFRPLARRGRALSRRLRGLPGAS